MGLPDVCKIATAGGGLQLVHNSGHGAHGLAIPVTIL
jgi:hypothetical protein